MTLPFFTSGVDKSFEELRLDENDAGCKKLV
jgi:hypothetical protein